MKKKQTQPVATKFGIKFAKEQVKKDYSKENTSTDELVTLLEKEKLQEYYDKVQTNNTQVAVQFSLEELKVAIEEMLHDRKSGTPM